MGTVCCTKKIDRKYNADDSEANFHFTIYVYIKLLNSIFINLQTFDSKVRNLKTIKVVIFVDQKASICIQTI